MTFRKSSAGSPNASISSPRSGERPFFPVPAALLRLVEEAAALELKVDRNGGDPVELAEAPAFRGGAWSPDGQVIYIAPNTAGGIWKMPAGGGEAEPITTPDRDAYEHGHRWPDVLPGGKQLLYTVCCTRYRIMVL